MIHGCVGCGSERTGYRCLNVHCPFQAGQLCSRCATLRREPLGNRLFGCLLSIVLALIAVLLALRLGNLVVAAITGVAFTIAAMLLRAGQPREPERFCCPNCGGEVELA